MTLKKKDELSFLRTNREMLYYRDCQGGIKSSAMSPTIRREVWHSWTRVLEAPCCAKHLPCNCLDYGEASGGPGWEARPSGLCSEDLGWCLLLLTTNFIILVCTG